MKRFLKIISLQQTLKVKTQVQILLQSAGSLYISRKTSTSTSKHEIEIVLHNYSSGLFSALHFLNQINIGSAASPIFSSKLFF